VPLEKEWVPAYVFKTSAIVEEVRYRPVPEAAWASLSFRGEVWSVAAGVLSGKGMLDCELHGCVGGMSGDADIVLSRFFRGDGTQEKGVIMSIRWLGDSIVISGTVTEE